MPVAVRPKTNGRSATSSDVVALLKRDHKAVAEMFAQVEALGPRAVEQRRKLGEKICEALVAHSTFEKEQLYPPFRERAEDKEEREQILEAFEEHAIVDRLVEELQGMDAKDERYEAKLMVLIESVKHHVKEEEREVLPVVKELFEPEELLELGERFIEAKRDAGLPVP